MNSKTFWHQNTEFLFDDNGLSNIYLLAPTGLFEKSRSNSECKKEEDKDKENGETEN